MFTQLFRIKICGVTRSGDASTAAAAGADAIGLNFYPESPRFLELATAKTIAVAIPSGVAKVGVFVNSPLERVLAACQQLGLDYIQLHGDEPPVYLAELKASLRTPVIRAFRLTAAGWNPIAEYVAACRAADCLPAALLIDAHQPGVYGGTGTTVDWQLVKERPPELAGMPVILAGGLDPNNVAQAVEAARPWGVDTASGVEESPGKKDPERVRQFIARSRAALESRL